MNKPSDWRQNAGNPRFNQSVVERSVKTGQVGPMGRVGGSPLKGKDKPESGAIIGKDINGVNLASFTQRRMKHGAR